MTEPRWNSDDDRRAEEEVRRLIEEADARPEIPAEDLADIRASAEIAWRQSVERARFGRKRGLVARSLVPLLAATLVAALALAWWLWPRSVVLPQVASVERLFGEVLVATADAEEPTGLGMVSVMPGQSLAAGSRLRTGSSAGGGSGAALRLVSGASLRLDAESELELVTPDRVRLTAGGVYFDSGPTPLGAAAGSPREPAIWVETSLGAIRDIGTQFSVRVVSGDRVEVRVREGEVAVGDLGLEGESAEVVEAGNELLLAPAGESRRRVIESFGESWSWVVDRAPEYATSGKSVEEFLLWFSRETGLEVRYGAGVGEDYRRAILRGSTRQEDPMKAAVVALAGASLRGELGEGHYTVSIAVD